MRNERQPRQLAKNFYEVLGVPIGASIGHVKNSYRLLSNKTPATEAAYISLTDPEMRGKYDADFLPAYPRVTEDQNYWGKRGRERCSCGRLLEVDDEWLCEECWDRQVYFVAFDMFGARIVHQDEFEWPTEGSEEAPSDPVTLGPFTREEAEAFLAERNKLRDRRPRL